MDKLHQRIALNLYNFSNDPDALVKELLALIKNAENYILVRNNLTMPIRLSDGTIITPAVRTKKVLKSDVERCMKDFETLLAKGWISIID